MHHLHGCVQEHRRVRIAVEPRLVTTMQQVRRCRDCSERFDRRVAPPSAYLRRGISSHPFKQLQVAEGVQTQLGHHINGRVVAVVEEVGGRPSHIFLR